jgi:hypothetical protein
MSAEQNHYEHHPDGKQLNVRRDGAYERNEEIEKFLGRHGAGWKIHLNVAVDKMDALTKEIASFLDQHPYVRQYKIGRGGEEDDGKGMTIYIGSWDRMVVVAHALQERFGDKLPSAKAWSNIRIIGNISARFDAQDFPGDKYATYSEARGLAGLKGFTYDGWNKAENMSPEQRMNFGGANIGSYTNDFRDYLWGHGVTERFRQHGISGLPEWGQRWYREGNVPFDLETAPLPNAIPVFQRKHPDTSIPVFQRPSSAAATGAVTPEKPPPLPEKTPRHTPARFSTAIVGHFKSTGAGNSNLSTQGQSFSPIALTSNHKRFSLIL